MADIPVQKKTGFGMPWWLWLLLAILIIALLVWLLADDDDASVSAGQTQNTQLATPTQSRGVDRASGPVTSIAALVDATSNMAMAGREVDLEDVAVQSLAGDMAFWVGENPANRVFVVFDQQRTPDLNKEGKLDINRGSSVNIEGIVLSAETGIPNGVVAELPSGTKTFIHAKKIKVKD